MTSIAAYLAGLAGGSPQDGQKTSQAASTGAGGLFAALLSTTDGEVTAETDLGLSENPLGLLAESTETADGASVKPTEIAGSDVALSDILTQGLAQTTGDVEAEIIETPENGEAIAEIETPAVTIEAEKATPGAVPVQSGQSVIIDVESSIAVTAAAAAKSPQEATGQTGEDGADNAPPPAGGTADTQPQARPEAQVRNSGLENALQRASQRGQQNGLQNALNQAPQAKANQNAAPANGGGQAQPGQPQSSEAEGGRPQIATSTDNEFSIRSRAGQPDATPKEISTFQRILDAGNGKKVIQIHERIGGEPAGTTSPPTLTVNVQASAASPGPASPNTPHVPVSALAVHIAQQFKNGARRFDIRLDPPELGRIDVRLDVSRDGQVSTHLVVERAETLDLLQRDARQLERALQDAGLDTSKEDMKFSLKDQGLAQGGQEDPARSENDTAASGRDAGEEHIEIMDDDMPPPTRYQATAGLDIRI